MTVAQEREGELRAAMREVGLDLDDAYRWLEDDSEAVRTWQQRQNEAAREFLDGWGHLDRLRALVSHFGLLRRATVPRAAGGRWFRLDRPADTAHDVVIVSHEPFGAGSTLFDPAWADASSPPYLSWISPAPDGAVVALGVCVEGTERNVVKLLDVATGEELSNPPERVLADAWTGGAQWLADSSGFFFTAVDGIFLHHRPPGTTPTTTAVPVPWRTGAPIMSEGPPILRVSGDGRHVTAFERVMNPIPVAIGAIGRDADVQWSSFVTEIDGTVAGHVVGDRYIAMTDVDAPRGRIVAIPLGTPAPNDPTSWVELLPQSDRVIRGITPVGDTLYVTGTAGTYAWASVLDLDGTVRREVPLPGRGAIQDGGPYPLMQLLPRGHPDEFVFTFSTFTSRSGVYRHRPCDATVQTLREPQEQLTDVTVLDRTAVSGDGTRVPYEVVARRDVDLRHPQPTLIFGYGGFNVALPPLFPDGIAAFVASGGVYVHAHPRGGGELGLDWWRGGRLTTKQNSYDDVFAIAEDVIAAGFTMPSRLVIVGGSHGGLMAGVAITQRPELWAAAVLRVPMLDLLAACRDDYGRAVVEAELADPNDPGEVARLATFSPYQLVRSGEHYPAVFLEAGALDHRCPAWHARKFAARLEEATVSEEPVLLRIWDDVGHGLASGPAVVIEQNVEWLAFVMRTLGMTPADPR